MGDTQAAGNRRDSNAGFFEDFEDDALLTALTPHLMQAGLPDPTKVTPYLHDGLITLTSALRPHMRQLEDAVPYLAPVLTESFDISTTVADPKMVAGLTFLRKALMTLPGALFTAAGIETAVVAALAANLDVDGKTLLARARFAITGVWVSLPPYQIMAAIGKYETLRRLGGSLAGDRSRLGASDRIGDPSISSAGHLRPQTEMQIG